MAFYITLWWLMVVFPYYADCQPSQLPAFYPIAGHSYGIKEGLPDMTH
ncbi:MAG: hypothetical protein H6563_14015 [Lewinellaceae bacterium]|nr:hypothetical protein [Lewinellaceae bacterium]